MDEIYMGALRYGLSDILRQNLSVSCNGHVRRTEEGKKEGGREEKEKKEEKKEEKEEKEEKKEGGRGRRRRRRRKEEGERGRGKEDRKRGVFASLSSLSYTFPVTPQGIRFTASETIFPIPQEKQKKAKRQKEKQKSQ